MYLWLYLFGHSRHCAKFDQINTPMKAKIASVLMIALLMACASNKPRGSYKPKYKKPDSSKPLPCPMKDC